MLRVTVELVPGGFEPLGHLIAAMEIGNISDLADRSDYLVRATESHNRIAGLPPRSVQIEVRDHDRRQSVWALIAKAAKAVAESPQVPPAK